MTDFNKLNPNIPCKNCLMWVMCRQRTLLDLVIECKLFSDFVDDEPTETEKEANREHTM